MISKSGIDKFACDFPADFDINKYQIFKGIPERILKDGDLFDLRKRTIKVIHTPGHQFSHTIEEQIGGQLQAASLFR